MIPNSKLNLAYQHFPGPIQTVRKQPINIMKPYQQQLLVYREREKELERERERKKVKERERLQQREKQRQKQIYKFEDRRNFFSMDHVAYLQVKSSVQETQLVSNLTWRQQTSMPVVRVNSFNIQRQAKQYGYQYPKTYRIELQPILTTLQNSLAKSLTLQQSIYILKSIISGIQALFYKYGNKNNSSLDSSSGPYLNKNSKFNLSDIEYYINVKGECKVWIAGSLFLHPREGISRKSDANRESQFSQIIYKVVRIVQGLCCGEGQRMLDSLMAQFIQYFKEQNSYQPVLKDREEYNFNEIQTKINQFALKEDIKTISKINMQKYSNILKNPNIWSSQTPTKPFQPQKISTTTPIKVGSSIKPNTTQAIYPFVTNSPLQPPNHTNTYQTNLQLSPPMPCSPRSMLPSPQLTPRKQSFQDPPTQITQITQMGINTSNNNSKVTIYSHDTISSASVGMGLAQGPFSSINNNSREYSVSNNSNSNANSRNASSSRDVPRDTCGNRILFRYDNGLVGFANPHENINNFIFPPAPTTCYAYPYPIAPQQKIPNPANQPTDLENSSNRKKLNRSNPHSQSCQILDIMDMRGHEQGGYFGNRVSNVRGRDDYEVGASRSGFYHYGHYHCRSYTNIGGGSSYSYSQVGSQGSLNDNIAHQPNTHRLQLEQQLPQQLLQLKLHPKTQSQVQSSSASNNEYPVKKIDFVNKNKVIRTKTNTNSNIYVNIDSTVSTNTNEANSACIFPSNNSDINIKHTENKSNMINTPINPKLTIVNKQQNNIRYQPIQCETAQKQKSHPSKQKQKSIQVMLKNSQLLKSKLIQSRSITRPQQRQKLINKLKESELLTLPSEKEQVPGQQFLDKTPEGVGPEFKGADNKGGYSYSSEKMDKAAKNPTDRNGRMYTSTQLEYLTTANISINTIMPSNITTQQKQDKQDAQSQQPSCPNQSTNITSQPVSTVNPNYNDPSPKIFKKSTIGSNNTSTQISNTKTLNIQNQCIQIQIQNNKKKNNTQINRINSQIKKNYNPNDPSHRLSDINQRVTNMLQSQLIQQQNQKNRAIKSPNTIKYSLIDLSARVDSKQAHTVVRKNSDQQYQKDIHVSNYSHSHSLNYNNSYFHYSPITLKISQSINRMDMEQIRQQRQDKQGSSIIIKDIYDTGLPNTINQPHHTKISNQQNTENFTWKKVVNLLSQSSTNLKQSICDGQEIKQRKQPVNLEKLSKMGREIQSGLFESVDVGDGGVCDSGISE